MKSVNLTIGERLAAQALFKEFKGDIVTLSTILEDVKKFPVSEEEWKEAGLVKTPSDEAYAALSAEEKEGVNQTWQWQEDKALKDIELDVASASYLSDSIKKKSDDKQLSLDDRAIISLAAKLK